MAKRKIAVFAANPSGLLRLRLDEEIRSIQRELQLSDQRDKFDVAFHLATRASDIQRVLLESKPQIVHFSGHGEGSNGLILEDGSKNGQSASTEALEQLFSFFSQSIECVVLNACYSKEQADFICRSIDYVIGMSQDIGDEAAIEFSSGFYRALGNGSSYEEAYQLGCNAISLANIPEAQKPQIRKRTAIRSQQVFISYRNKPPDLDLARQLHKTLDAAGHSVFMASESIRLGENWSQRVQNELESCDYFLLLLSPQSVSSEMVTEEIRVARQLRDLRDNQRPTILPVRVNFPASSPLNYDQRGYLNQIHQYEWESDLDTPLLVKQLLVLLAEEQSSEPTIEDEVSHIGSKGFDSSEHPPIPVAEPELPGGQLDIRSKFYVERPPTEEKCYQAVARPGSLIRIKAPRQMGKTSLMSRILEKASEKGMATVPLTFQLADSRVFSDLDKFLKWFCLNVGRRLGLPNRLRDMWDSEFYGSKDNCTIYFEEYLLPELDRPIVLGMDEVDMVFQHDELASDFFGLLRAWHESGKTTDLWKKLNMVIVHSTEVYVASLNINQSPFNVGLAIELKEFSVDSVQELVERHGLRLSLSEVNQLMSMVGGHPYLLRVALYQIAKGGVSLAKLLQEAPTDSGPYGDHLRRLLWNLESRPDLMVAFKSVIDSLDSSRLDSLKAFQLNSLGLVNLQGNDVTSRCELYRQYFKDRLRSRGGLR